MESNFKLTRKFLEGEIETCEEAKDNHLKWSAYHEIIGESLKKELKTLPEEEIKETVEEIHKKGLEFAEKHDEEVHKTLTEDKEDAPVRSD